MGAGVSLRTFPERCGMQIDGVFPTFFSLLLAP